VILVNSEPCVLVLYVCFVLFFALQTLEKIKLTQIEKFHKANSDFEREVIELDPKKVIQQAVENCKPLLILKKIHRGGVIYQVCIQHVTKNKTQVRGLPDSATQKQLIKNICPMILSFD